MLVQDYYALDPTGARALIAAHGRATIVTADADGPRATYGFFLLEPADPPAPLTVVGHIAKADPQAAALLAGQPTLLAFDGPHGYISASWYRPTVRTIPSTWNYSAVHLLGTPEVLTGEAAFDVLRRTLAHHEAVLGEQAWRLEGDAMDLARRIAPGTLAFRLAATRVEAKAKLSQDKPAEVVASVIDQLEGDGPYAHPALAADMRAIRGA